MRAVIQRVTQASVTVDGETVGQIGPGLVILAGVGHGDGADEVEALASKIAHLRIFADDGGKMNRSLLESGGGALVISQFTLHGDCRKGRRPSFVGAADPETAAPLVDALVERFRALGVETATGRFGAMMQVALVNDGPVTIVLDTDELKGPRRGRWAESAADS